MTYWSTWCNEEELNGMEDLLLELQEELSRMDQELGRFEIPEHPVMEDALKRLIHSGGKRLRPSLAWVCYAAGTQRTMPILPLMCMLELMHTASLIHDDIVDDAGLRRNEITIHAQAGRLTAVNSGDYLLGKAMEYLKVYRGTGINEMLADVSAQMCMGEFSQMRNLFRIAGQSEETCFTQIRQKTAYLISASCFCGAAAGGMDQRQKEALWIYGERIGIAFQLRDDLLDFTAESRFGKKRGQDLKNGIFTLPLLHAFAVCPDPQMFRIAQKEHKSEAEVEQMIQYVIDAHGMEYTQERIRTVTEEAVEALKELPGSLSTRALAQMAKMLDHRTV